MPFPDDQVAELKKLCANSQQCEEGNRTYILLPRLVLPEVCLPQCIDALLCPTELDGYASRLFFAERVGCSAQLNWNANRVRILERNWDAFSWKVPKDIRLIQMIAAHLRAFK